MPEISRFFGIIIRMYYSEHNPPHLHAIVKGKRISIDFLGNVLKGTIESRTVLRLIREWIDRHHHELNQNWELTKKGKSPKKIDPLN